MLLICIFITVLTWSHLHSINLVYSPLVWLHIFLLQHMHRAAMPFQFKGEANSQLENQPHNLIKGALCCPIVCE